MARRDDAEMFELAPISLWLEDYTGLKAQFDSWRQQGVTSLRDFLRANPEQAQQCSERIRVLKVNRRTLSLYEADSLEHLIGNLSKVFRADMLKSFAEELCQLWDGQTTFTSNAVNYTLSGQRLDIQLKGMVLPGYELTLGRVLLSIEDVTERETMRRQTARAEEYARTLFEHSPISLWVEDFSSVKHLIDEVRSNGISDFRVFTDVHPEFVRRCLSEIRIIDVNHHTLEMFAVPDKATLIARIGEVLREDMHHHFREQLIDLWNGELFHTHETVNYRLDGEELHLHLQFSVLPGHEHDWSLVQIALTDITARKKAEAYLEYLGKHDVLTKLYNRSFYIDELNRLERKGPFPVTVIMVDLDNLKQVNDQLGHAAGDTLLRRAGEVLTKAVDKPSCAARIGGDEFALLLPGTDAEGGVAIRENIERLIVINNQFYSASTLSMSIGMATSVPGERLEAVVKRADIEMYRDKRKPPSLPDASQ